MTTGIAANIILDKLNGYELGDWCRDDFEDFIGATSYSDRVIIGFINPDGVPDAKVFYKKEEDMGSTTTKEPVVSVTKKKTLCSIVESDEQKVLVEAIDLQELMNLTNVFMVSRYCSFGLMDHKEKIDGNWVAMLINYLSGYMAWDESFDLLSIHDQKLSTGEYAKILRSYVIAGPTVRAAILPLLGFFKETIYGNDGAERANNYSNIIPVEIKYKG